MSARRIVYGRRFSSDLDEIGVRLTRETGARTADKWIAALRLAVRNLEATPEAGAADPALGDGRRRLVVAPYLIIYELRSDEVRVLRIVHGARDLPALFGS